MRLIAHRGLVDGPNSALENQPSEVHYCLTHGLDAEIDIWYQDNKWFLGHDRPTCIVDQDFISLPNLWIHAKNAEACQQLSLLSQTNNSLNFFWHENDARVLTSQGFWWTNPQQTLLSNSIAVMPEWYINENQLGQCLRWNISGICSDYINKLKK